jgi:hypothetical protein
MDRYITAPSWSQAAIDARHPQTADRTRYKLNNPGSICVDGVVVQGPSPDGSVASQLIWLSATVAASFGATISTYP